MNRDIPNYYPTEYRALIPGHPLLRILASFPIACFCGALVTDIAYATTYNVLWVDFSDWLLAAGMAIGVLAALAGLVALATHRRAPARPRALPLVIGGAVVLALALLNNLVHSRDVYTSVMPEGLILSALTVAVTIATVWAGSAMIYRGEMNYAGTRP